jgi:hypothetical protein
VNVCCATIQIVNTSIIIKIEDNRPITMWRLSITNVITCDMTQRTEQNLNYIQNLSLLPDREGVGSFYTTDLAQRVVYC